MSALAIRIPLVEVDFYFSPARVGLENVNLEASYSFLTLGLFFSRGLISLHIGLPKSAVCSWSETPFFGFLLSGPPCGISEQPFSHVFFPFSGLHLIQDSLYPETSSTPKRPHLFYFFFLFFFFFFLHYPHTW